MSPPLKSFQHLLLLVQHSQSIFELPCSLVRRADAVFHDSRARRAQVSPEKDELRVSGVRAGRFLRALFRFQLQPSFQEPY